MALISSTKESSCIQTVVWRGAPDALYASRRRYSKEGPAGKAGPLCYPSGKRLMGGNRFTHLDHVLKHAYHGHGVGTNITCLNNVTVTIPLSALITNYVSMVVPANADP